MARSYDVRVWAVRTRKRAGRATSYELRWTVAGTQFAKSYTRKAQATSAAADLHSAAKHGDAFDTASGQPSNSGPGATPTVLTLAREVYAKEWADGAGKSRKSLAEAMAHAVAVLTLPAHPVDADRRALLYQALYQGDLSRSGLRARTTTARPRPARRRSPHPTTTRCAGWRHTHCRSARWTGPWQSRRWPGSRRTWTGARPRRTCAPAAGPGCPRSSSTPRRPSTSQQARCAPSRSARRSGPPSGCPCRGSATRP